MEKQYKTVKEFLADEITAESGIPDDKLVPTGNTYFNGTETRDCDIYDDDGELESVIIGLREVEEIELPTQVNLNVKQVIVLRKDLGMRKGKMIAQGAHASLGAVFKDSYVATSDANSTCNEKRVVMRPELEVWFNEGFTKIALSVNSEEELHELHQAADTAGLTTCLIQDAGRTEFKGEPTYTALAIGPNLADEVDLVTGKLSLL